MEMCKLLAPNFLGSLFWKNKDLEATFSQRSQKQKIHSKS